jgi:hypothetical protein
MAGQNNTANFALFGVAASGTTNLNISKYDGSFPGTSAQTLIVSGQYQVA